MFVYHSYYGTVTNVHLWEVAGNGVTTSGVSLNFWTDDVSMHVDYTRAVNTADGSEIWVAQYNCGGQNAGSVIATFSPDGGNIYAVTADGTSWFTKPFRIKPFN